MFWERAEEIWLGEGRELQGGALEEEGKEAGAEAGKLAAEGRRNVDEKLLGGDGKLLGGGDGQLLSLWSCTIGSSSSSTVTRSSSSSSIMWTCSTSSTELEEPATSGSILLVVLRKGSRFKGIGRLG